MTKERVLQEAKEHMQYTHEILRKTFNYSLGQEKVLVSTILENIENDVQQLEMLYGTLKTRNTKKNKIRELEIEE